MSGFGDLINTDYFIRRCWRVFSLEDGGRPIVWDATNEYLAKVPLGFLEWITTHEQCQDHSMREAVKQWQMHR